MGSIDYFKGRVEFSSGIQMTPRSCHVFTGCSRFVVSPLKVSKSLAPQGSFISSMNHTNGVPPWLLLHFIMHGLRPWAGFKLGL